MAGYVSTSTSIYTDPDLAGWSALAIHLYLYLWHNDHVHGITGIGRVSMPVMQAESRLTPKQMQEARKEIANRVAWFADGTYWVTGRPKHTCYTAGGGLNAKCVRSAQQCIMQQCEELQAAFARRYPDLVEEIAEKLPADTLPIPHQYPMDTLSEGDPDLPTVSVSVSVDDSVSVSEESTATEAASIEAVSDGKPPDAAGADSEPPYDEIAEFWNTQERLNTYHACTQLTATRRKHIRARWREELWRTQWREVIRKSEASDFLVHQCKPFDFTWVVKNPENYVKILEGRYDNKGQPARGDYDPF